jgi:hypothetical protein
MLLEVLYRGSRNLRMPIQRSPSSSRARALYGCGRTLLFFLALIDEILSVASVIDLIFFSPLTQESYV